MNAWLVGLIVVSWVHIMVPAIEARYIIMGCVQTLKDYLSVSHKLIDVGPLFATKMFTFKLKIIFILHFLVINANSFLL